MQFVRKHVQVGSRSGRSESVLLIDHDHESCRFVKEWLEKEAQRVETVHNGPDGLERALYGDHAIAILDIRLPGFNGFELLRRLRASSQMPVIVTTARPEEVDRIVAFEVGADDYLSKPFNPRELVARLRAVLRRISSRILRNPLRYGHVVVADVEMDPSARIVRRSGQHLDLTATEFDLLHALLQNAGRIVPRDDLAQSALGRPFSPLDRSIDLHVSHLRRKLGEYRGGPRIRAIRGIGYLYALPIHRHYCEVGAPANESRVPFNLG